MVVCDGLKGLPEAINTVWSRAVVQTCVIHLLRNTFRYASRRYWDQIAKDILPVYTAATEAAAKERFIEFTEKWDAQYPAITALWENAWSEFVPFLDYGARREIGLGGWAGARLVVGGRRRQSGGQGPVDPAQIVGRGREVQLACRLP